MRIKIAFTAAAPLVPDTSPTGCFTKMPFLPQSILTQTPLTSANADTATPGAPSGSVSNKASAKPRVLH